MPTVLPLTERLVTAAIIAYLAGPGPELRTIESDSPKFEVASVRPCKPGDGPPGGARGGASGNHPGRLSIVCQTVEHLVQWAYVRYASGEPSRAGVAPVQDQPIEGGPSWVKT